MAGVRRRQLRAAAGSALFFAVAPGPWWRRPLAAHPLAGSHRARLVAPPPPLEPAAGLFRMIGGVATEDDVRRIALALPETTEKPWYGSPGFRVKDKGFLRIRSEAEGGLVVFVADLDEKEALLASEPDVFFTTPHYDGYPAVLVDLHEIELDELTELIVDSWRLKAPKRVLAKHEDQLPGAG